MEAPPVFGLTIVDFPRRHVLDDHVFSPGRRHHLFHFLLDALYNRTSPEW